MARKEGLNFKGQFGYSFGSILNIFRNKTSQGLEDAQNKMQQEQRDLVRYQDSEIKKQQKLKKNILIEK